MTLLPKVIIRGGLASIHLSPSAHGPFLELLSLESDASQRVGSVRNLEAKHKQEFLAIQADAKKLMEQVKKASDSEADAQYGQLILHYHDLVGTISGDMLASPQ